MTRVRKLLRTLPTAGVVLAVGVAGVRAQEPLAAPAPLSQRAATGLAGASVVSLAAAQRAQDLGLPSIAADLYRQLRDAPGADRPALGVLQATALLDAGEAAAAEKVLQELPEPHDAAWRLRAGLAALQLGQRAGAQAQWDSIREAEVPFADLGWYRFLTGALWDTATPRDVSKANGFYQQAEALAPTPMVRARFQLAAERVRLHIFGKPSENDLRQARENAQRFAGQAVGYDAARNYATMLAESDRRGEAVEYLQQTLVRIPASERGARDEMRFLLGLIGDRSLSGAGRNALVQLLEAAQNVDPINDAAHQRRVQRQRQALQLLAEASRQEPERRKFRSDLDRLLAVKPPAALLESLYYYRAQFALAEKDFSRAEADAIALGNEFPLSPLRVHALTVLAQSAWEQRRYRAAADYARQARKLGGPSKAAGETPGAAAGGAASVALSPRVRVDLGVLEAEASFRANDYRSAADAYAAVLQERPADMEPGRVGELMFQWVLAETKAGTTGAATLLDRLARDPAFDVENRWEAEWSLARALNLQGDEGVRRAFTRISELLREAPAGQEGLNPELRAKMAWLQTKLAFDSGQPAEALALAEAQLKAPLEIEPALKREIASIVTLLKARSEFALGREPAALETLKNLREVYSGTEAAISSYLIESEHYAAQDKLIEARTRLIELSDNPVYQSSRYVPYALYRLALLSERLGREENLKEANQRIEDLFKPRAAAADPTLVFAARMRQGDIFRKLNDFPSAQRAYEYLVNTYSQRRDVVLAQLALADCHSVQASPPPGTPGDPVHADTAQRLYEQLRDRVDAPRDVQVEAGFKLGALLLRRGKLEEAAKVWWSDVVYPFLKNDPKPVEPEAKRPYWLGRTLCDLGELQEKRGRFEEARAAYALVLEKRLPFGETARARLQQLGVPAAARPGQ